MIRNNGDLVKSVFIPLYQYGYTLNEVHEIPVATDGSFERTLPIADVQDIYLYLNNTVTLFSHPGDTITLRFEGRDPVGTLEITGTPRHGRRS